jgi:hypothetical protein
LLTEKPGGTALVLYDQFMKSARTWPAAISDDMSEEASNQVKRFMGRNPFQGEA